MQDLKKCRRCQGEHQAAEMGKGGWCPACRADQRERTKKHYQAHREEIRARQAAVYRAKRGGTVKPYRTVWPEGMKGCPRCKTVKPLADFRPDTEKRLGVKPYCRTCDREYQRSYSAQRTPEQRARGRERTRQWSKSERGSRLQHAKQLRRLYGLTAAEYKVKLDQQGGLCGICQGPETRRTNNGAVARMCVDHDHQTDAVRDLLCHGCNQVLSHSRENTLTLERAIDYLRRYRKNTGE